MQHLLPIVFVCSAVAAIGFFVIKAAREGAAEEREQEEITKANRKEVDSLRDIQHAITFELSSGEKILGYRYFTTLEWYYHKRSVVYYSKDKAAYAMCEQASRGYLMGSDGVLYPMCDIKKSWVEEVKKQ